MTIETVEINSERIDDIPVILEWLKKMEIAKWIDKSLSKPHGNHQGLSYGQLSVLLLTYIVTQADHRLCAVENWVKEHLKVLESATGWTIGEKDTSDDRLAKVAEELGKQEEACNQIEMKLGKHLVRTYELPTEVARTDTSSFSVHHQEGDSLLRYGHSKDKRPDLLQYRQLLGTIDPAGIPLVSATLAGNGADDPLYWPTWQKLAKVIGHKEFIYIADCKAGAIATRAQINANGGTYCFPLPMIGQQPAILKQWVLNPPEVLVGIRLPRQVADEPDVGKGLEIELGKFWFNAETKEWVRWDERYLIVHSYNLAAAAIRGQEQRLEKAEAALSNLAAKLGDDLEQVNLKVEAILKRHRVTEFLVVTTTVETITETRYIGRGRPTAKSVQEQVQRIHLQLKFHRKPTAIEEARQLAGWRLYVTNAPITRLTLSQAVVYYRDEWLLERGFHRFKRGRLPAIPMYFQNQDRIVGLMFLLTIALRVFTLMEFVVRLALETTSETLAGLYEGNPKRVTARPSAEQLLKAFCNLTLYLLPNSSIFVSPLSMLQRQILSLMNIPESIYCLDLRCRGA
jgi:transposase